MTTRHLLLHAWDPGLAVSLLCAAALPICREQVPALQPMGPNIQAACHNPA